MLGILKGAGYVLLAVMVLGIIGSVGAIFATIGVVIGAVLLCFVIGWLLTQVIKQSLKSRG